MTREERRAEAARLYTENEQITMAEVGEQLGVSKATIYKDLKAMGVESRPGPEYYRAQRLAQQAVRRKDKQEAKERRRQEWEDNQEYSLASIERLIDSL